MPDPTVADIAHAVFVRQEYRYSSAEQPDVYSRNPEAAREVSVNTNLDQASAQALAARMLPENVRPRAFQIGLEGAGIMSLAGGPPSLVLNSALGGDGVARKVFSITTDWDKNVTTVQVRG